MGDHISFKYYSYAYSDYTIYIYIYKSIDKYLSIFDFFPKSIRYPNLTCLICIQIQEYQYLNLN